MLQLKRQDVLVLLVCTFLAYDTLLLHCEAILIDVEIVNPSLGPERSTQFFCPTDTLIFTCEITPPTGTIVWSIMGETTELDFRKSGGNPPAVGSQEVDASTRAIATLTTVNDARWVSTLTLTLSDPGTSLSDPSMVTVICYDFDEVNNRTLTALNDIPTFLGDVAQNTNEDTLDKTTVISWQPAAISQGGVTYIIDTDDGNTARDSTIMNYTQVIVDNFNIPYNICVEATNECGVPSGTPSCTTIIIDAEVVISNFNVGLTCSVLSEDLLPQKATATWTVNKDRIDNILQPPVTVATISCIEILNTTFAFTSRHMMCFNPSQDNISLELNLMNATGIAMKGESVPSYFIAIPDPLVINDDGTAFIPMNPYCSEDGTLFELEIVYIPSDGNEKTTVTSEFNISSNEFEFLLPNLESGELFKYDLIVFYNGNEIERRLGLSAVANLPVLSLPVEAIVGCVIGVIILSVVVNIVILCIMVTVLEFPCFLAWPGPCKSVEKNAENNAEMKNAEKRRMHPVMAMFVWWFFFFPPVTTVILICYLCCCSSDKGVDSGKEEEMKLRGNTLPQSEDPADTLPTYADPNAIRREEAVGTHDLYTVPEKKTKKKPTPEETAATCQAPETIQRQPAPESGELYTVIDQAAKRGSQKKPAEPQAKSEEEIAAMYSVPDKSREENLQYSDLALPPSGSAPPQDLTMYSEVHS